MHAASTWRDKDDVSRDRRNCLPHSHENSRDNDENDETVTAAAF
jgi:hypothetical protein